MDLAEFKVKVKNEFGIIKAYETITEKEFQTLKKTSGCLMMPVDSIIEFFAEKFLKKEKLKRNHKVFESEANELLQNSEIKKAVCSSLLEKTSGEILTEDDFINFVTDTLFEKKLRDKFIIPLEPGLFAYIAFKVSENGIRNFCAEQMKK